jgi:hypothetical protein
LTQKLYGKSRPERNGWVSSDVFLLSISLGKPTFFVANQAKMEAVSPEKLADLEAEYKAIDDANKLRANEIRTTSNGGCLTSYAGHF